MLTLPNILTLSRIFAIPLLAYFLWWPGWAAGYLLAFGLYCLMGITDYFDGYLARTSGTVSKLGIFLDPIADKIMVAAVILVLAAQFESLVHPLTVMLALPLAMVGALAGLWATGNTLNLFSMVGLVTLWGAAILTVITGWDYLRVGLKHMD